MRQDEWDTVASVVVLSVQVAKDRVSGAGRGGDMLMDTTSSKMV